MKMKVCLYMFLPKDYFLKKKIVVKDLHKHSGEMIIILNDVLFQDKQRFEVHEEIFEVNIVKFNPRLLFSRQVIHMEQYLEQQPDHFVFHLIQQSHRIHMEQYYSLKILYLELIMIHHILIH